MTDFSLPAPIRARLAGQRDVRYGRGTRLTEKCIRCHSLQDIQTLYYKLCNICRAELIDTNDPDERERWKIKYRIRH